jgi:hypothetical protein
MRNMRRKLSVSGRRGKAKEIEDVRKWRNMHRGIGGARGKGQEI